MRRQLICYTFLCFIFVTLCFIDGIHGKFIGTPRSTVEPTGLQDFPFVGSVRQGQNGTVRHVCGGVVVFNSFSFLTSTSCISPERSVTEEFNLLISEPDLEAYPGLANGADPKTNKLFSIVVPYSHVSTNLTLLRYKPRHGKKERAISPVKLPETDVDFVGERCVTVGHGSTKNGCPLSRYLQISNVTVMKASQCKERLGQAYAKDAMCAIRTDPDNKFRGDIGGPLLCVIDDNDWILAGILQSGVHCGTKKESVLVFTKVFGYKKWLYCGSRAFSTYECYELFKTKDPPTCLHQPGCLNNVTTVKQTSSQSHRLSVLQIIGIVCACNFVLMVMIVVIVLKCFRNHEHQYNQGPQIDDSDNNML